MLVYIVIHAHSPGTQAVFATRELADEWIAKQEDRVMYDVEVMTVRGL